MKNCRKKLKNVVKGSLWSDRQFDDRIAKLRSAGKKADPMGMSSGYVVTEDDIKHANLVLRDFADMEPAFMRAISDENNWVHEGLDENDDWSEHEWSKPSKGCNCGCG